MHREQKRRIADEEDPGDTIAGTARHRPTPLSTTELSTSFVLLSYVADLFMLPYTRGYLLEERKKSPPLPVAGPC